MLRLGQGYREALAGQRTSQMAVHIDQATFRRMQLNGASNQAARAVQLEGTLQASMTSLEANQRVVAQALSSGGLETFQLDLYESSLRAALTLVTKYREVQGWEPSEGLLRMPVDPLDVESERLHRSAARLGAVQYKRSFVDKLLGR